MKEQTRRGLIRTGSIIMLVGIFLFPFIYMNSWSASEDGFHAASVTMFDLAIRYKSAAWLPVPICAIGLLVSSWIPNAAIAKAIRILLQVSAVGATLWNAFTNVWTGQTAASLGPGAEVNLELGFWIISLGLVIAMIGTLVPEEAPGK